MGLSARQVGELVAELAALIVGTELRGVQALPPRDLLLVFTLAADEILRVRLSADAESGRLHLQSGHVKRHEGPADPFFARLETALSGAALQTLEQVQGDRVVRFVFRRDGAPAGALLAELTGRHGNLVRLDGGGRIQDVLVPPAAESPAAARLKLGAPYALPPGKRAAGAAEPSVVEAFAAGADGGRLARLAPLSARVENALGGVSDERFESEQRRELVRRLEQKRAGAGNRLAGLTQRAAAGAEAERVRMDGELLLAHLTAIPRGASSIELADAYLSDSPPRRIALDPGLSARRNAEKLFARYKKLVRTLEHLPAELEQARAAQDLVARLVERAALEDPSALEAEAVAAGVLSAPQVAEPKHRKPAPRLPYLSFRALHGSEIRVGRNARDNDQLTFRESNGNDLWLHTADSPGSHVVLRVARAGEPDEEEVLDAAHLALHFSPLRGATKASIHVARRKEVHKPRKAPAGLVTLSGGKTLHLRLEAARLERLLRGRGRADEPGA
ncbi:MAG: DUF814 domain-containing protein [Planctomycetes bacterium]|nr:DUF814 domain-containing protein [Planctomycetota bacterium]